MLKFRQLNLLFFFISTPASAMVVEWDNPESGTGLHVSATGVDREEKVWTLREVNIEDKFFYHELYSNEKVFSKINTGKTVDAAETDQRLKRWVECFASGYPTGKLSVVQNDQPVGAIQLYGDSKPGVGEITRIFDTSSQGKGLGHSALNFLLNDWAPFIRQVGLGQTNHYSPAIVQKFNCFGNQPLHLIATTARPSNPQSWQCYKHFDFTPTQPTDKEYKVNCESWEKSQHGELEEYIIHKHYSEGCAEPLKPNVLYAMTDEEGRERTLSFVEEYQSLRYHFQYVVK